MFIEGFSIHGFRSFGKSQRIGPLGKVNIFIGQNNCGKSNVLLFLRAFVRSARELASRRSGGAIAYHGDDLHINFHGRLAHPRFEFGMRRNGKMHGEVMDSVSSRLQPEHIERIEKLLGAEMLLGEHEMIWFPYDMSGTGFYFPQELLTSIHKASICNDPEWHDLRGRLNSGPPVPSVSDAIGQCLRVLCPTRNSIPEVVLIPALRKVGEKGSEFDYGGGGILHQLAQRQNPPHDKPQWSEEFAKINQFVKTVLENDSAEIMVTYNQETINVKMDGKILPLTSIGMGIHQVIMMAVNATILRRQIVCIEEPEIHLHPLLQKQLIRYLTEQTDNQYFVTTHSAHLIDTEGAEVYHVRLRDNESVVERATTDSHRWNICASLGYRPSDLMQANSVIWVEGPSDRIYLNHWIRAVAPKLIEGIHYSIMFYGGSLLSHLSADDLDSLNKNIESLISLRRLNRNIAILMDSDKKNENDKVNDTKVRAFEEFNSNNGIAWITKGRTIENYIDPQIILKAMQEVHPRSGIESVGVDKYSPAFVGLDKNGDQIKVDKVKVAQCVTKEAPTLNYLDLQKQVEAVVKFIKCANGSQL